MFYILSVLLFTYVCAISFIFFPAFLHPIAVSTFVYIILYNPFHLFAAFLHPVSTFVYIILYNPFHLFPAVLHPVCAAVYLLPDCRNAAIWPGRLGQLGWVYCLDHCGHSPRWRNKTGKKPVIVNSTGICWGFLPLPSAEIMKSLAFVRLFVCLLDSLFICEQRNSKTDWWIFFKFSHIIEIIA